MTSSEDALIRWLAARGTVTARIGNDAAVFDGGPGQVATMDTQIGGVHVPHDIDERVLGRRTVAVNTSDLAAMGAVPLRAFLALTAPPSFRHRRFFEGVLQALEELGAELAGGDLSSAKHSAAVMLLLGELPEGGRALERRGARVGDTLWAGGTLGESALGQRLVARGARLDGRGVKLPAELEDLPPALRRAAKAAVRRHLLPAAQLELGGWLGRQLRCAALDVSDGLALDGHRLLESDGLGARIEEERLPLAASFRELCARLRLDPLELTTTGGEDYVLLFTLPPETTPPARFGAQAIGEITAEPGLRMVAPSGRTKALGRSGWDHLANGDRNPTG